MSATPTDWTADMLDAIPDDGRRWEIIDGRLLVTPSPSDDHQFVVGELHVRLHAYLKRSRVGRAVLSPSDVRSGNTTRMQTGTARRALDDGGRSSGDHLRTARVAPCGMDLPLVISLPELFADASSDR